MGPSDSKNVLWPNGVNSGCFRLHMSQNVATYINTQSHQPVLCDSLHAVCLAGQVGTIYRPPEQPWTPDRPVNKASVKANH